MSSTHSVVRGGPELERRQGRFLDVFLGDNLLPYLVLALGAALVFGNGMALVRPPKEAKEDELARAPVGRSAVMIAIGFVAAIWALASLVSG